MVQSLRLFLSMALIAAIVLVSGPTFGQEEAPPAEGEPAPFDVMDADGDGSISREEAQAALGDAYSDEEFDAVDADGDGSITVDEWNASPMHGAPAEGEAPPEEGEPAPPEPIDGWDLEVRIIEVGIVPSAGGGNPAIRYVIEVANIGNQPTPPKKSWRDKLQVFRTVRNPNQLDANGGPSAWSGSDRDPIQLPVPSIDPGWSERYEGIRQLAGYPAWEEGTDAILVMELKGEDRLRNYDPEGGNPETDLATAHVTY